MRSLIFTVALVCFPICLPISSPTLAATKYVDGSVSTSGDGTSWNTAFKKIQEGIDATSDGDTVLVAEGTYVENIRFNGKNIALTSTDPFDLTVVANTVIDGNQADSVVTFSGTEGKTCLLWGFTIRKGKAENGAGICGGSSGMHTHATIRNNVVSQNSADNMGGGLAYCDGTIEGNAITENTAPNGAGLFSCNGLIRNNVIAHNSAAMWGGALYLCHGAIESNTIYGNSAGNDGAGVARCEGTIRNCILWHNRGKIEFFYSSGPTYCCIEHWRQGGEGNISDFPHFVDAAGGDFHLRSWSPCVDAGDPISAYEREPRPNGGRVNIGAYGNTTEAASKSGDSDGDGLPDEWEMEFFTSLAQRATDDPDADNFSNAEEYRRGLNPAVPASTWYVDGRVAVSGDGTSWATASKTIQEGIDAASPNDNVRVAEGVYPENTKFTGKNVVIASTDPLSATVVARTIIDGGGKGSVVTFDGNEDESCVLSGLTIRNGKAGAGGGICGGESWRHTHAAIRNNVVTDNQAAEDWQHCGLGGGLAYCDGLVVDNVVIGNSAESAGGGLYWCDGTIQDNVIASNSTTGEYSDGAGLSGCEGTIQHNSISGNYSAYCGGGLADCRATIHNNTIWGNRAANIGGGLYRCSGAIQGNVIRGNSARQGAGLSDCYGLIQNNAILRNSAEGWGGGLCYCGGAIVNNTIYGNSAEDGGGLSHTEGDILNCIIWGNKATSDSQLSYSGTPCYSCIEGWAGGGIANTASDPLFVGELDYTLQVGSPCIDSGVNGYWLAWPQSCPDGGCRLVGSRVDMGCYEYGSSSDSDGDLLSDSEESEAGTLLSQEDTDGDGLRDGIEIVRGSDPLAPTPAGVFHVPQDFSAIQEALAVAQQGDEIIVSPGTYVERIWFPGTDIVLRSSEPSNPDIVASTVIDGGGLGIVVRLTGSETEACVLEGFTITGGKGQGIWGRERIEPTHATIRNNVITRNGGAGVVLCDGVIRDNAITNNGNGLDGGGLGNCDGLIENNFISGNSAAGGMHNCDGTIQNNIITGNSATGGGGGLYSCSGVVIGNTITGNTATVSGGGMYWCQGLVRNNVVCGNFAQYGGGLNHCTRTVENNTIADNFAVQGGGLYDCTGTIKNCIIWGNIAPYESQLYMSSEPSYSCIQDWGGEGIGNISLFPHFVYSGASNYHLQTWSPCVDAGDPASDFSNEPQPNGGRINMGAYGNTTEAASASEDTDGDSLPDDWEVHYFGDLEQGISADPDNDGKANLEEYRSGGNPATFLRWYVDGRVAVSGDGTEWKTAFKTVQEGINAASHDDTVLVAQGTYVESIHFKGKNIALRSTDPLNPAVVGNTVIDGNGADPVVRFSGTEEQSCVLAGFTIRNGKGGICGFGSCATIRSNVIRDNSESGLADCDGTVQNNVVTGNGGWNGGGLRECDGIIQNNLIARNSAKAGGGLYWCQSVIQNNTIAYNSAEQNGGGLLGCRSVIRNCVIWGNAAGGSGDQMWDSGVPSSSCIQNWEGGGTGIRTTDPMFLNEAEGDYHLQQGSPCIGYGSNFYWSAWPQRDLDGNCRLVGTRVDMGCYEFGASFDSDGDLLSDSNETAAGTRTDCEDTDEDGLRDGLEALRGTDPLSPTPASKVHVPSDISSVQEALCLGIEGEEVIVAPGFYRINVELRGLNVVLRSVDPDNPTIVAATVLDGQGTGPVVTFKGCESSVCVLSGFTIVGGQAFDGGGILGQGTHATVQKNTIVGNSAANSGGGIAFCDGIIQHNTVSANSAERDGGGLAFCQGDIRNNVISGNIALWGSGGGFYQCHGTIQNNFISGNQADDWGGGLALCGGSILNNIVAQNTALNRGGGLWGCYGLIQNNTIADNSNGGLYGCSGIIVNCIIWGNRAWQELYKCSAPAYSCIEHWREGGEGNLDRYPHFVNAATGDYHLRNWSPCIDAGDPGSPFSEEPIPNEGRIDMGAYGNTPEATSASADSDLDELADDWEFAFFGNLSEEGDRDFDGDLMSNSQEYRGGFDPTQTPTWHVDASVERSGDGASWQTAFKTIQEGIDAASEGDTVLVAPGAYTDEIVFGAEKLGLPGKNIVLRSVDPFDPMVVASTVIEGGNGGRAYIMFSGQEKEYCILAGFTIRRGSGVSGYSPYGSTRATIQNNVISENATHGVSYCDGLIQNNTITDNSGMKSGAGLYECNGMIRDNVIARNSYGGLVHCDGFISNNTITENGGWGLLYCGGVIHNNTIIGNSRGGLSGCDATIENNLIALNRATKGAGLYECDGVIHNNTIVANSAEEEGGGLYGCNASIRNCIIWGNTAALAGEQIYESFTPSFSCVQDWAGGGIGVVSANPAFVDVDRGDYHLQEGSSCIDAGVNYYWFVWPQRDLDGNCRLTGSQIDIGCYEFGASPDSDGDLFSDVDELAARTDTRQPDSDGDGLRDGLEFLRGTDPLTITSPAIVHVPVSVETIQKALCIALHGDEIVVVPGAYFGNSQFCGANVILRSSAPGNPEIVKSTILDATGEGPVVSFTGAESESCSLSGFTIRNGNADSGGGVLGGTWNRRTHATIRNNIITLNTATYRGGGGLAYCDGLLQDNIIVANLAVGDCNGGGLAHCGGLIQNNNIVWNCAESGAGALYDCKGVIRNCIIGGSESGCCWQVLEASKPTYCCIQNWSEGGEGNISEDPAFFDADGADDNPASYEDNNYCLTPGSPCIDAGFNSPELPETDIAGMHRTMFGGKSLTVDMGAYEFYINTLTPGPQPLDTTLTWSSLEGKTYSIFYTDDLFNWHTAIDNFPSSGNETTSWLDDGSLTGIPPLLAPKRFYRVLENP